MMIKLTQSIQFVAIALLLEATTPFLNPFNPNVSVQAESQPSAESVQERSRPMPPPRPDFASAAQKLGTTEPKLVEALGLPPKPPEFANTNHPQGCMPPPRLDFTGASKKLNVSKADLLKALNLIE